MSAHVLVLVEPLPYPLDPRVRAQVAALREAGHDVTVACPTGPGCEERDGLVDGVRVRRFRAPNGGRGALGYLREYAMAFVRLHAIVRAVGRERTVDLVLVCAPPDLLVALARPLVRRGAAVLFDYREISPELFEVKFGRRGPAYRALVLAERYALQRADAVTTVSEPCAELARERGGVEPARVFLVGNGPDPTRVHPVAPRPELRRGREHLVLWLGVMSVQERLERLIEAADDVVRGHGREDVHFAVVGPGDAREMLQREIAERDLGAFVELTGAVGDELVRAYIATADVCVGVDERNGMNDRAAMRKVLEYLALGKAVVQFPLAEMQRLCGDASVYARNGDAADLAARICELLDDDERRRRLGALARRRAHGGLMWPQQVPALLAAVDAALGRRAAPPTSLFVGGPPPALRLRGRRRNIGASSSRPWGSSSSGSARPREGRQVTEDHIVADHGRGAPEREAIPIVLADDHVATRAGVRLALEGTGFAIVAEVSTADAAVEAAIRHRPALCLLDLYMPGGGISAARRIHAEVPEARIVFLTVSPKDDDLFEALVAGASGYLMKDTSADRLPVALHGVLAGEAALPRTLERRLIEEYRDLELRERGRRRFVRRRGGVSAQLTAREWEVFGLISETLPTTVVAQRLGISDVTVRRHISSVMQKLNVRDRAAAVDLIGADDPPD